jgi:hypothetical protein
MFRPERHDLEDTKIGTEISTAQVNNKIRISQTLGVLRRPRLFTASNSTSTGQSLRFIQHGTLRVITNRHVLTSQLTGTFGANNEDQTAVKYVQ